MAASSRVVEVAPHRLSGWLTRFEERHGQPLITLFPDRVELTCPDQAQASIALGWGPLLGSDPISELLVAVGTSRRVAGLIVRKRGHAVGIFDGASLTTGRHDHHYAQGRTKAGGWSQQRYARRRENQARHAYAEATSDAVALFAHTDGITALAVGGDQSGVEAVLADERLAWLTDLPQITVPGVPVPNATVLTEFGQRLVMAQIRLNEFA